MPLKGAVKKSKTFVTHRKSDYNTFERVPRAGANLLNFNAFARARVIAAEIQSSHGARILASLKRREVRA
jgi:hypothetical protein